MNAAAGADEPPTAEIGLPAKPESVRLARRFVRDTIARWGLEAQIDIVLLLVSELVTNAVLHARTTIGVRLEWRGDRLHVAVSDASARDVVMRDTRRSGDTGRGLLLVERLADGWGVMRRSGGKAVWFDLRVRL